MQNDWAECEGSENMKSLHGGRQTTGVHLTVNPETNRLGRIKRKRSRFKMQGNNHERGLSCTTHKRLHLSSASSESVLRSFWPLTLSGEEASTVSVFKSLV